MCAHDVLALRSDLHREAQRSRKEQGQQWEQFETQCECSVVNEEAERMSGINTMSDKFHRRYTDLQTLTGTKNGKAGGRYTFFFFSHSRKYCSKRSDSAPALQTANSISAQGPPALRNSLSC